MPLLRRRCAPTDRPARVASLMAAGLAVLAAVACGSAAPVTPGEPPPAASPTGAPPGAVPPDPITTCVDPVLGRLDLRGRAAQLIMAGVPADGLTDGARAALARGVGGVILTDAAGGEASASQVAATVRQVQAAATVPALVATDQEGGRVQDLAGAGFTTIPSAEQQGRDPDALRTDATGWARQLAAAGVTLDLAPVADVVDPSLGDANAPVGALGRGYGTDPQQVGTAVDAFVSGMADGGVATTLKHFPGLGRVRENTDFAGASDDTMRRDDPFLASFRDGIAAGAPVVMMSSATYTRIDPDHQALFSSAIVTDLLRGDLNFRGVVMTDDVGAAAALADVPVGQRAVRFVEAGGDLVLTVRPTDAGPMIDALTARAAADPAFATRLDESARRVLALKATHGPRPCD